MTEAAARARRRRGGAGRGADRRGRSFCAGGDLGWMRAQIAADAARGPGGAKLAPMLGALDALPKPLIGRVQGNAFGGGVGLISVCDVAIGAGGADGLHRDAARPDPGDDRALCGGADGEATARRVFMSAAALRSGGGGVAGPAGAGGAGGCARRGGRGRGGALPGCAPGAVAEAKALVRQLGRPHDEGALRDSVAALVTRWESPEAARAWAPSSTSARRAGCGRRRRTGSRGAGRAREPGPGAQEHRGAGDAVGEPGGRRGRFLRQAQGELGAVGGGGQARAGPGGRESRVRVCRSVAALVTRWESPEAGEGVGAFFDKRKASWVR